MPKEERGDGQGCVGERECTSRPASKNAKDKSTNAALLASRARAHMEQESNRCDSHCSEKDSGYSDTGSDSLQTDADDQQIHVNEPRVHKGLGEVKQGPLQGGHILVSGTPELTPVFIIKNVVLKQPGQSGQKHIIPSSLSWDGDATRGQGPTRVLLLQQPGINQSTSLHMLKPQPQRTHSKSGKKSKNTYLPILNSYPRIAPHPSKKMPENTLSSRGSTTEEHSLRKRVCTEKKREEVSTTTQAPKQHLHKQQEGSTLVHSHSLTRSFSTRRETLTASHQHWSSHRPSSPSTSLSVSSPSVSSTQTPSPHSSNDLTLKQSKKEAHKNGQGKTLTGTARHRRFLNTVEILSQSGLLDITLRTQDLLRQNAATERDIVHLRQHVQLLCQAAQVGADGPDAPAIWEKLHQVMADSRHYPNLKCLCSDTSDRREWSPSKSEEEAATSTKPITPEPPAPNPSHIYRYGLSGMEEVAPPSPLLAPMPDTECQSTGNCKVTLEENRGHRETAKSPEEPIMPPDSSTHKNLH